MYTCLGTKGKQNLLRYIAESSAAAQSGKQRDSLITFFFKTTMWLVQYMAHFKTMIYGKKTDVFFLHAQEVQQSYGTIRALTAAVCSCHSCSSIFSSPFIMHMLESGLFFIPIILFFPHHCKHTYTAV